MASTAEIEAAAAAIANARGARRGAPEISNILTVLMGIKDGKLFNEVMEDAEAALTAAEKVRICAVSDPEPAAAEQKTPICEGKVVGGDGLEPPTLSV